MDPQQHLQNLSTLNGCLNSYWLEESGFFISGPADNNASDDNVRKMMNRIFQLRTQIADKETFKKTEQIIIHGSRKIVIHQFMGRPDNRILLTSVLDANANLTKFKIKLYAISEDSR